MFSGIFIAEEADEVGDKGSGDTTMVDVQTILEAFCNMSTTSAYFNAEAFSGKKQNFRSLVYSPQVSHYQVLHIKRHCINRNLLCIHTAHIVGKKFLIHLQFKASYLTNFCSNYVQ